MDIFVVPFLLSIKAILGLAVWIVIADVIVGWLTISNVINVNNRFVIAVIETLSKLTAVMLAPIRQFVPITVGALDLSPVVLILILSFFENVITRILLKFV
ncbi:MAG: YggT family protein [Alphaproteobacteria bacterium]|nr:YggT family protein [Alphaproteobacteria bacterium]